MRLILICLATMCLAACNTTNAPVTEAYIRDSMDQRPLPPDDRFGQDVIPGEEGPM